MVAITDPHHLLTWVLSNTCIIAFYIGFNLLYFVGTDVFNKHMASNLSTVAVVPMTNDVPISNFTGRLTAAIKSISILIVHNYL